jgi:hypothetical protein
VLGLSPPGIQRSIATRNVGDGPVGGGMLIGTAGAIYVDRRFARRTARASRSKITAGEPVRVVRRTR